jgi:hypothetical protein
MVWQPVSNRTNNCSIFADWVSLNYKFEPTATKLKVTDVAFLLVSEQDVKQQPLKSFGMLLCCLQLLALPQQFFGVVAWDLWETQAAAL